VLERVNEIIYQDIPPKMFVTCLYALLDPESGQLLWLMQDMICYHHHQMGGVTELSYWYALGLMPGMSMKKRDHFTQVRASCLQ
jgi:hypothetical protein